MKYVTIISFCLLGCKICGRADKSSILYTFFENVCIKINLGTFLNLNELELYIETFYRKTHTTKRGSRGAARAAKSLQWRV